jgi:hypothetical protein
VTWLPLISIAACNEGAGYSLFLFSNSLLQKSPQAYRRTLTRDPDGLTESLILQA